jgi:hypothetical protein
MMNARRVQEKSASLMNLHKSTMLPNGITEIFKDKYIPKIH